MHDIKEKVCLIIPCYNEADRLDIRRFKESLPYYRFLFVNDGSSDGTAELIQESLDERTYLLNLPENKGKAEAVRIGMLHAYSNASMNDVEWLGFWDADLATPLPEVDWLLRFAKVSEGSVDAIWGSRRCRLCSDIDRSFTRHYAGRLFATAAGLLLHIESYDSQCGSKLFRKSIVEMAFRESFLSRWLFDIEILLRLRGCSIIECPLRQWRDVSGKDFRFFEMAAKALPDLIRIRRRYLK